MAFLIVHNELIKLVARLVKLPVDYIDECGIQATPVGGPNGRVVCWCFAVSGSGAVPNSVLITKFAGADPLLLVGSDTKRLKRPDRLTLERLLEVLHLPAAACDAEPFLIGGPRSPAPATDPVPVADSPRRVV